MLLPVLGHLLLPLVWVSPTSAANPKRGLAFAEGDNPNDILRANQTGSSISWVYNWGTTPPDYLSTSRIPYASMQWGADRVEDFASAVRAQGAKGRTVLGFNEPDFASQSNIDPVKAAQLWLQYIQPLQALGARLIGPAVTNAPSGLPWLSKFLDACTGCQLDAIAIHWYGSGIGSFYDYLWQVHYTFPGRTIWVTEFAETSADDNVVADFLNQTIRYMDTLDWIGGYSWFAFFRQESGSHYNLLDANGNLNTLGKIYVQS
ncbi:hypothetical protein HGRIS_006271 [Hohenbuehelia grisea]|uniref:Asl1-like glycosyl hydrolase catalytic domain-containing protein n=1 Tax=Hohenbuehelia grisea TaxID=104357 RepID=A0ABR3K095_9AGAR